MDNSEFLKVVASSFLTYLRTSSRSNEKLKILHGAIASDFASELRSGYLIRSLGHNSGKEGNIDGRYIDKVVDITVSLRHEIIAGIAVKFVMSNYSQNSNNYFENMLGETANIRCKGYAYFQILVLPEKLPHYDKYGNISSWDVITSHNLEKYMVLSTDDTSVYLHTPNKTLLYLVKVPEYNMPRLTSKKEFDGHYIRQSTSLDFVASTLVQSSQFGRNVVLNDYEQFKAKVLSFIRSI